MTGIMEISEEDIKSFEECKRYTIAFVECGELGVPLARLFANAGFKVICANSNPHVLKQLNRVRRRVLEDEDSQTSENEKMEKSFEVTSSVREAASAGEIVVISVETAIDGKGRPNYSPLERTCKEVGMGLNRGSLVLFVTQTGPGIIEDNMCSILESTSGFEAGRDFGLASSPMKVMSEKNLDTARVIGAIDEASLNTARLIFSKVQSEIVEVTNIRTVEALSLFMEAKKEANLAMTNEFAKICERLKIDFLEILKAAERSHAFSLPSPGLIADSIRRNSQMLLQESENADLSPRLMLIARKINDEIVSQIFRLIKEALKVCGKTVRSAKVSVIGISQMPNCKVTPGAPRMKLVSLLRKKVKTVHVYDPFFSKKELVELGFESEDFSRTMEGTDCLIILVGHSRFERLNLKRAKFLAKKSPALIDVPHIIDPLKARKYGFVYRSLGSGYAR